MEILLSARALGRIRREAGKGNPEALETLAAEAFLGRWLRRRRVPCWCNPSPPGRKDRYGLLLPDGTRILVVPVISASTRDNALNACCAITAVVKACPLSGQGLFSGWITLAGMDPSNAEWLTNAPEGLPGILGVPRRFMPGYIAGSVRLLLAGEPVPPKSGLKGVPGYTPRRVRRQGKGSKDEGSAAHGGTRLH